jgi:hypothetical protein
MGMVNLLSFEGAWESLGHLTVPPLRLFFLLFISIFSKLRPLGTIDVDRAR